MWDGTFYLMKVVGQFLIFKCPRCPNYVVILNKILPGAY